MQTGDFSAEQIMLRDSARTYFEKACPQEVVREIYREPAGQSMRRTASEVADFGWTALLISEQYGGLGAGYLAMAVLLEEFGRRCMPSRFFSSAVLASVCIERFGSDRQKERLLPALAGGTLTATLAFQEGYSDLDRDALTLRVTAADGGYALSGRKEQIADAAGVDCMLVLAPALTKNMALNESMYDIYVVSSAASGVHLEPKLSLSGSPVYEIAFDGVRVGMDAKLNDEPISWQHLVAFLCHASVLKCAEMVGGASRAMEVAIAHAKERKQFGKPIGTFQAIQHHCANMLMHVESARWLTYENAAALDATGISAGQAAKVKLWCNAAYREVVRLAHQVLGGGGYCEDHEMPLIFRHARQSESALGDMDSLMELVASELIVECSSVSV